MFKFSMSKTEERVETESTAMYVLVYPDTSGLLCEIGKLDE